MSESLYMTEIEQILEKISEMSTSFDPDCRCERCLLMHEPFADAKSDAVAELVKHYGLNPDDAESEVRAAAGLEP